MVSRGVGILSALYIGLALLSVVGSGALAWALGKLSQPIGIAKSPDLSAIDVLMSGNVASYTFPKKREEQPVSEDHLTGQTDVDIRIELAKQGQKVEGLTNTVEREFARMAEALGKHADAVNQAFAAMKNDFISKSDANLIKEDVANLKKVVYGACGVTLLSVVAALLALVLKQ